MSKETMVSRIASYCYCKGALNTMYGNWTIYFEEIEEYMVLPKGTINELKEDIIMAIEGYEGVSDVYTIENSFDINYYTDYCPSIEDDEDDE